VQRYEIITNDKKNFTEQLSIDTYKLDGQSLFEGRAKLKRT